MPSEYGKPASPEHILGESKSYLRKAERDLLNLEEFVENKTPESMNRKEVLGMFVELRKSFQNIDYWTRSYGSKAGEERKSDLLIDALLEEKQKLVDRLEKIEKSFGFDFESFEKKAVKKNKTKDFLIPEEGSLITDSREIPPGVDFEQIWEELFAQFGAQRDFLLSGVRNLIDSAATGTVDIDLFEELRDGNVSFVRAIRELRRRLSVDPLRNRYMLNQLSSFESEAETRMISELLVKFFKEHVKDERKGDEKRSPGDWPLKEATKLVEGIDKIMLSLGAIQNRVSRNFDHSSQNDDDLLNQIKKDFDELLVLLESLQVDTNFIKKIINLLPYSRGLEVDEVAKRQQELEVLLRKASELGEYASEVEYIVWSKLIFITYPELVELDREINEVSPALVDSEVGNFNQLISFAVRMEPHLGEVDRILETYSEDNMKMANIVGRFLQPSQTELEKRREAAYEYWQTNLAIIYPQFNEVITNTFMTRLVLIEGFSNKYISEQDIAEMVENFEDSLREAREEVEGSVVQIPDGQPGENYNQHLASFWNRAQEQMARLQKIQTEKEDGLKTVSSKTVRTFFEQGFVAGAPKEWREGEWRKESPSRLAKAIWDYVDNVLIGGEARETEAFMTVNLLGDHLDLGHAHPSVLDLCKSFMALSETFDEPKKTEIFELGDKLIKDITQVQSTFNRGHAVSKLEGDPGGLIKWYLDDDNQMTRIDFQRTSWLGEGYLDKEGEKTVSERLLWAQHAFFAMNEPDFIGTAWLSTADEDNTGDFARNVRARNSLTIFPLATASAESVFVKRDVIRFIAGSDNPPKWITHPVNRKSEETLSQFANRKRHYMKECIQEILYGRESSGDLCSADNASRGSFWGKYKMAGGKVEDRNYLTADQKKIVGNGHLAEQLSMNLGEYSLEPCKAEGQKMIPGLKTIQVDEHSVTLPVLDALTGATSIFILSRSFYPQSYRRKLTKKTTQEGSPGPRETLDDFYSVADTQYDRYWFIPDGEKEGVTLKEATILADSREDFINIPWSTAVTEVERNNAWTQEVKLSMSHWDRIVKNGLGISWHQIVKTEPGSSGSLVTFDAAVVIDKFLPFFRDVTYMMQRDKGVKLHTWKNKDDYQDFLAVESHYRSRLELGDDNPSKPAEVEGILVKEFLWNQVKSLNRLPTAQHVMVDISEPEDDTGKKMTRFASLMPEVVRTPNLESMMDSYERAVINNPDNSQWDIWKKLFAGKIIIGSMASSDVEAMDYKDIRAIRQLLSEEVWRRETQNDMAKLARKHLAGRKKAIVYQGVGIFSNEETKYLLETAGVPVGMMPVFRSGLEAIEKFQ